MGSCSRSVEPTDKNLLYALFIRRC